MKTARYEWTTSYVEPETQKFTDDLNRMSEDGWEIYALLRFAACNNEMSDFVSIVARREIPVPGPLPAEETVPLPRCTVCNRDEFETLKIVECAVCGRNVCKGCAHHKIGHHYHPKCDAGWQR